MFLKVFSYNFQVILSAPPIALWAVTARILSALFTLLAHFSGVLYCVLWIWLLLLKTKSQCTLLSIPVNSFLLMGIIPSVIYITTSQLTFSGELEDHQMAYYKWHLLVSVHVQKHNSPIELIGY